MLLEYLEKHMGKIIGVLIGLIFGYLAIKYSLIKALFVALCAFAGYHLGKRLDDKVDFRRLIAGIFQR